jgi:phosphoglycolate phosphatase-like HAD superfamily hydrolase
MKKRSIRLLEASGVASGLLTEKMLNYEIEELAVNDLEKSGLTAAEIKRILRKVATIMDAIELEAIDGASIMDGVGETLQMLKNRGVKIGIITRSCREYAISVIDKFGLQNVIDAVAARDDVLRPKPAAEHPRYLMKILGVNPSETALVGDHLMDALCAENADIKFFLLARAETDLRAFKGHNHEVLHDIRELVCIIEQACNRTHA